MIRLLFCVRRLASLTPDEFTAHWLDVHGPLVRERAALLGIRRYEQSHTVDSPIGAAMAGARGSTNPYDGLASLWFDSEEALARSGSTPQARAGAREILADERRFIDLAHSPLWMANDVTIVGR